MNDNEFYLKMADTIFGGIFGIILIIGLILLMIKSDE